MVLRNVWDVYLGEEWQKTVNYVIADRDMEKMIKTVLIDEETMFDIKSGYYML